MRIVYASDDNYVVEVDEGSAVMLDTRADELDRGRIELVAQKIDLCADGHQIVQAVRDDLHGHAFALALDAIHPAYKKGDLSSP